MEYIILCAVTGMICCAGVGLLYLASSEIEVPFSWKLSGTMILSNLLIGGYLVWRAGTGAMAILRSIALVTILWVCAWTDYKKYLILNRVLLIALVMRVFWMAIEFLVLGKEEFRFLMLTSLIAAAMLGVGALLCKLVSPGGVGYGDIKLLIVFGLYTGVDMGITAMIFTFLALFVLSVFLLITRRANRKTTLPFAPFLLAGTVLALF